MRGRPGLNLNLTIGWFSRTGSIKHVHNIGNPVLNESGDIAEFVGTVIDVTDQHKARTALEGAFEEIKTLRDQLYKENIALREEIDKVSMFEEIVGSSDALRKVLVKVSKVAPRGCHRPHPGRNRHREGIRLRRAIHKQSRRSAQAFIRVNCGAISRLANRFPNCSVMKRAPLPAHSNGGWAALNRPTAAPSSWTKLVSCQRRPKLPCCAYCR